MSEDQSGSGNSVHVLVVDEEGDPVTGQDVAAHFSSAWGLDTVNHQYTDTEGTPSSYATTPPSRCT